MDLCAVSHLHCYLDYSGTRTTNYMRAADKRRPVPEYVGTFRRNPLPFQRLLKIGAPYEAKTDQHLGLAPSRALP